MIIGQLNAHYLLIFKGNQPLAYQTAQTLLTGTDDEFADSTTREDDQGHARTERRTLRTAPADDTLFPGARQALLLRRDVGGTDGGIGTGTLGAQDGRGDRPGGVGARRHRQRLDPKSPSAGLSLYAVLRGLQPPSSARSALAQPAKPVFHAETPRGILSCNKYPGPGASKIAVCTTSQPRILASRRAKADRGG